MREKDIKEGRTYRNKGKGKTIRKVLSIGAEHLPKQAFNSDGKFPEGALGVLYMDNKHLYPQNIWLKSFASWAGSEVQKN